MSRADDAQKLADRMALDQRIAAVRDNLNTLTEQAAGQSGGTTEEFINSRIASQEELLANLLKERDALG
jgi:hypothetical protein